MKVVVAGGTGLIGSFLLKILESSSEIETVRALTRREQRSQGMIDWRTTDFENTDQLEKACQGAKLAFCCLGTTIRKAGSQKAFIKVDHEFVIAFARAAKSEGIKSFGVVSAIGSNPESGIFYNRVKGQMEKELSQIGFESLTIMHPSILLGPRKEFRFGEKIGSFFMRLFTPLMNGSFRKYRPIHVREVAKGMFYHVKKARPGVNHIEYDDMMNT